MATARSIIFTRSNRSRILPLRLAGAVTTMKSATHSRMELPRGADTFGLVRLEALVSGVPVQRSR